MATRHIMDRVQTIEKLDEKKYFMISEMLDLSVIGMQGYFQSSKGISIDNNSFYIPCNIIT